MCGVVGVIGPSDASHWALLGLSTLQHRGQDAAGILSYDFREDSFAYHKDKGLISQVFHQIDLTKFKGEMALAHTRYQTVGSSEAKDLQPLVVNYPLGVGMAHNGNIVNFNHLANKLKANKRRLLTNNDLEILMHLFCDKLDTDVADDFEMICSGAKEIISQAEGGFAIVGMVAGIGLFAIRDPKGIRPLCMGESIKDGKPHHAFASESFALEQMGMRKTCDIAPGEVVFVNNDGKVFRKNLAESTKSGKCMFEWIYFAGPQSNIDGSSVYTTRKNLGTFLASKVQDAIDKGEIAPDVIAPVPDTSRTAAIALAETIGIPYREVLIKNRYVQRSFILKGQKEREKAISTKLSPILSEVEGKNILIIDDSIVRGTTSKRIISLLKQSGAKEVYMASTSPPIKHPCFFGIDFPESEELLAYGKDIKQISEEIGADWLFYMSEENLAKAIEVEGLCMACLNGEYPVSITEAENFSKMRHKQREQV